MAEAPLLLTTIADCGKQDAVVVWDPIAGNPVASFTGEVAAPGTLIYSNNVVFSAANKRPLLQAWSLQSNSSFKRITTKGPVNAMAFSCDGLFMYLAIEKSIYIYQVCSGCLIAVLEGSHIAPIGSLVVSQRCHAGLSLPLLLSADTSGLVACWPALISSKENYSLSGEQSSTPSSSNSSSHATNDASDHRPLWYAVQASRSLASCAFVDNGRMVACAGTDGIKVFESETGRCVGNVLGESRPLLCIATLPQDDRYVLAGTDNGVLHTVWLRDPKNPSTYEVSFRGCFVDAELSSSDKAITSVCVTPSDAGMPLVAVSTRGGLVEILRQDASLVRMQRFSVAPPLPGNSAMQPRLTGFIMVARPAWLLEAQTTSAEETATPSGGAQGTNGAGGGAGDALERIRPLKRHLGWQLDDLLYMQLPNLKRDRVAADYLGDIYHDTFRTRSKDRATFARPVDFTVVSSDGSAAVSKQGGSTNSSDIDLLRREKEALEKKNGDLMRIMAAYYLHY